MVYNCLSKSAKSIFKIFLALDPWKVVARPARLQQGMLRHNLLETGQAYRAFIWSDIECDLLQRLERTVNFIIKTELNIRLIN